MKLILKRCTPADLPTLRQLSIETFTATFASQNTAKDIADYIATSLSVDQLQQELHDPASSFYFVYAGAEMIGYLKLNQFAAQTEKDFPDSLEIERIYLKPAYQRKGLGTALLQEAIQLAQAQKVAQVWLGVWEKNLPALNFYQKNGFVPVSAHSFFMGG